MRPGFLDLLPLSGEISSDRPYSWLDCQSSGECVSLERDDQQVLRLAYDFELTGIRRLLSRESLRNVVCRPVAQLDSRYLASPGVSLPSQVCMAFECRWRRRFGRRRVASVAQAHRTNQANSSS